MINIYEQNTVEYLKDGYYLNNTVLKYINETANFDFEIVATIATAYLEKVNEEKLKIKGLETTEIDSYSCIVTSDKIYLESQALAVKGTYRYKIIIDSVNYYSDLFCIEIVSAESLVPPIIKMESGILSVYDRDYLEYLKDGYYDNNTPLKSYGELYSFYFDSKLTISSVTAELYQINTEKLSIKEEGKTKIKDLSLLYSVNKVYFQSEDYNVPGMYQIKIIANGTTDFYTGLFCINEIAEGIGIMIIESTFIIG